MYPAFSNSTTHNINRHPAHLQDLFQGDGRRGVQGHCHRPLDGCPGQKAQQVDEGC